MTCDANSRDSSSQNRRPDCRWRAIPWSAHAALALLLVCASCASDRARLGPERFRNELDLIGQYEFERRFAPDFFASVLVHESPHVRARAARALGRLLDPRAVPLLAEAARDASLSVPQEVAFALGQIATADALEPLTLLVRHGNARVRALGAEALGKLKLKDGADLVRQMAFLAAALIADNDPEVRGAAALAAGRTQIAAFIPDLSARMTDDQSSDVRWRAAYALARLDNPAKLPALRAQLSNPDPWVRAFAAHGMRYPPDPDATEPLAALLKDGKSSWQARAFALDSFAFLRKAQVGDAVRIRDVLIEQLLRESHPLVLEKLLVALAEHGGEIEAQMIEALLAETTSRTVRRAALVAWGQAGRVGAIEGLVIAARDADPLLRAAALEGLAHCGNEALIPLAGALQDSDVRVRSAAVLGLAKLPTAEVWDYVVHAGVNDADFAVRGTAVTELRAKKPDRWQESLLKIYDVSLAEEFWETRKEVFEALKDERAMLESRARAALTDKYPAVRALARAVLGDAAPESAQLERASLSYPLIRSEDLLGQDNPQLELTTSRGLIVLELFLADAPHHVSHIMHLARSGFYDGLVWHRVVPAFVIQGGDPHGDGAGDAGIALPDEINSRPYLRGTLGMPNAGRDTGGCQLFITHVPVPRLDGRYTVFGQVLLGMDVVDQIEVGDRILSARVVEQLVRQAPRARAP
ncbi:MAG: HEAT repeat domain-containing protein [Planctomycetota bacterium]